jgi:hypothetical protein
VQHQKLLADLLQQINDEVGNDQRLCYRGHREKHRLRRSSWYLEYKQLCRQRLAHLVVDISLFERFRGRGARHRNSTACAGRNQSEGAEKGPDEAGTHLSFTGALLNDVRSGYRSMLRTLTCTWS